jgi:sporulation protein YunB
MSKDFSFNKRRYKKNFGLKKYINILTIVIVLAISVYIFIRFDNKVKTIVDANTDILANTLATKSIDKAINSILKQKAINSESFIMKNLDSKGNIATFSANTLIINEICSQLAVEISEQLRLLGLQKIEIPIGTITGVTTLLNRGPKISVEVLPSGTARANYNTEFYSTGINQVKFRVWLNIDVVVNIITPTENRKVTVSRKLTLVDTIIKGDVPPTYINTTKDDALKLIPNN